MGKIISPSCFWVPTITYSQINSAKAFDSNRLKTKKQESAKKASRKASFSD